MTMATGGNIGNTFPTLVDVLMRLDPNGTIATIAEVLTKRNPILQDMTWQEGNLPTGHKFSSRSALPSLTWRMFNQGVVNSKSVTAQHTEDCGMLTGLSKVDCAVAELNGNEAAFRASEDLAFVTGFNNALATAIFYSNSAATPEQFMGLSPRLSTTTANPAAVSGTGPTGTGQLVKADASASGANQTSIWAIGWAPETVFGIFPKGSIGGLHADDLGKQLVPDAANNQFPAWVTQWVWKCGLCVKDYRFVSRGCNIDVNNWASDLSSGADLLSVMSDCYTAIYNPDECNLAFYMARQTYNMLAKQYLSHEGRVMDFMDRGGSRVPSYFGIPIRFCDAITVAESVVS
jgi:hypothetical protein